jgi:hypothetical protein
MCEKQRDHCVMGRRKEREGIIKKILDLSAASSCSLGHNGLKVFLKELQPRAAECTKEGRNV